MILLRFALLTLAAIDVDVTSLDGSKVNGKLSGLTEQTVVITNAVDGQQELDLSSIVEIRGISTDTTTNDALPNQQLLLADGSAVEFSELVVTPADAEGKGDWLSDIKVPRSALRAVRFQEMQSEWTAEWNAFLKRDNQKDLLIRVKRDGSGLDFADGVVGAVTADTVFFRLDGTEHPIPRNRMFGIVFARSQNADTLLEGQISVFGPQKSQVNVRQVELSDDNLTVTTSWGQKYVLPGPSVRSIDFSSGRFHYLSDIDPVRERYFGTAPPGQSLGLFTPEEEATRTGNAALYRMSRDAFPYGSGGRPPLMLRGMIYRKGLCIFPSAKIDYALDGRYSKLVTLVGVDDEVAFNSPLAGPDWAVALRIEGDSNVLWEQLIKAPEDPIPVEIDLTGVQTLSLIVDFGDGQRYCDYLDLVNARLIVNTTK